MPEAEEWSHCVTPKQGGVPVTAQLTLTLSMVAWVSYDKCASHSVETCAYSTSYQDPISTQCNGLAHTIT